MVVGACPRDPSKIVVGACARDPGEMLTGPDWTIVLEPRNGEYANTTYFLTCDDWQDHLETHVTEAPPHTVVLMTDGIRDLVLKPYTWEPNAGFFSFVRDNLLSVSEPGNDPALSLRLRNLLDGADVRARSGDDTSIIAIQLRDGDGP